MLGAVPDPLGGGAVVDASVKIVVSHTAAPRRTNATRAATTRRRRAFRRIARLVRRPEDAVNPARPSYLQAGHLGPCVPAHAASAVTQSGFCVRSDPGCLWRPA